MYKTIPQAFIDDIIAQVDIVELIDGLVPLKKTGSAYTCCCPFHQEKTPSFNVIPHKQFFYCFGCGVSGNCIKFLMLYSHLEFPDAIRYLADMLGISLPATAVETSNPHQQLPQLLSQIELLYQNNLSQPPPALAAYLQQRGLTPAMIDQFHLGYAPNDWRFLEKHFPRQVQDLITAGMLINTEQKGHYDRFRHRLIFPLHNRKGQLIGFAGRVIDPSHKPKYMNPPETPLFHKHKELYGLYQVLQHQANPEYIIVVEGYLDVISLFQFGLPCAVATMGTATSPQHLHTLGKHSQNIIFCFDGDSAGRQAAWRALETCLPIYQLFNTVKFLFLPDGQDPDSYIREFGQAEFLARCNQAIPLPRYFAEHIQQQFGTSSPIAWIPEAKRLLFKLDEGPGKECLIEELRHITRLDPYRIRQLLTQEQVVNKIMIPQMQDMIPALRLALCLLLETPRLWQCLSPTQQQAKIYPELLNELMDFIQSEPLQTGAMLVERFRGSPHESLIHAAMMVEHHVHDNQLEQTLKDSLDFLIRRAHNEKIDQYLQKLRSQGLSPQEKQELSILLKNKHKSQITD